ncbi:MAG: molecular chaperone DnaJ [Candidatus Hydrogenedentes bacterium]|nr:molecular chaperone DnaJ [Candidatus Hydrogenedentota bacterium]
MPAVVKNFYEILGVSQKATPQEMRAAYLKLAHKYHPDKTGGDKAAEEKLKAINEAYDTLKNPEKRKQYDQELQGRREFRFERGFEGAQGFGGGAGGFRAEDFGGAGFGGFEDLFGSILGGLGGRARRAGPEPGNDVEVGLTVTLREAALGGSKRIRVPRRDTCKTCGGSGSAPGTRPQTCPTCGGSGMIQRSQGAAFSIGQPCPRCGGAGSIIPNPCPTCHGAGSVQTERDLTVAIPAGIESGARLRLAGEGEPGDRGGPRGDLYVQINVAPDDFFTREDSDVKCEATVPLSVAVLGGAVTVPTLTGTAQLKIPPGTQTGAVLRMRGLGAAKMHARGRGSQLVQIKIEVPSRLSTADQEAVKRMSVETNPAYYPQYQQYLQRLRQR